MLLGCELWQGFATASGIQGKGASSTQCRYLRCFTRSSGSQDGGDACAKILPLKCGYYLSFSSWDFREYELEDLWEASKDHNGK